MREFLTLIQDLADNPGVRAEGLGPPTPDAAVVLVGGLRELIATQVENGRPITALADTAVAITTAILTAG
ncbi:hypothetical protein [Nocardia blacklockiae]|uniref:hypothetical protein n=1 Tax=Nocardia blacklockiae TaxID=480036 RepID=UPI001E458C30|nr:hypothetical protein [Nocardia blacklockiae]